MTFTDETMFRVRVGRTIREFQRTFVHSSNCREAVSGLVRELQTLRASVEDERAEPLKARRHEVASPNRSNES